MAQRCTKHGLGAGPDGMCAICHRELCGSLEPPSDGSVAYRIWIPLGLAILGLAAFGVVRHSGFFSPRELAPKPLAVAVTPSGVSAEPAMPPPVASVEPTLAVTPPEVGSSAIAEPAQVDARAATRPNGLTAGSTSTALRPPPVPSSTPAPDQADVQRVVSSIPISLYEANWCPHCRRAKAWFAGQRLSVTDYDVDHDAQAKLKLVQYNPRASLPTIVIGDQVLVGFSEDSVAQTLATIASRRLGTKVTVRTK